MGADELDRIDRQVDIDTDAERVWALVSRPGWWINDGVVLSHPVLEQQGERHRLDDPVHGVFTIRTELLEPPRRAVFHWARGEGGGASTRVELTITDRPGGVRLEVVESGFSSLGPGRSAWLAVREENVRGWELELVAARVHLDPVLAERSVHLPSPPERVWPLLLDPDELAGWYAFGGATVQARPGGRVELRWDEHGAFRGRVREVVPPERFTFDLALEPDTDPADGGVTLVELLLRPSGTGTLLTVRQSGYRELRPGSGDPAELAEQDAGSWEAGLGLLLDRVRAGADADR